MSQSVTAQLDLLYQETIAEERSASRKSDIFHFCNVFVVVVSIVSGTLIASLALSDYSWKNLVTATLGIVIAALKTITTVFNFETKAATFKQISVKLRRLTRHILQVESEDTAVINKMLTDLYKEFDDLDVSLFNESNSLGRLVYAPDIESASNSPNRGVRSITPRKLNTSANLSKSASETSPPQKLPYTLLDLDHPVINNDLAK